MVKVNIQKTHIQTSEGRSHCAARQSAFGYSSHEQVDISDIAWIGKQKSVRKHTVLHNLNQVHNMLITY